MNKMFKKLMAVSATVAIAATMSVSAFAADVTVAPTDSAVTVTPTAVENATMYTVMVFNTTADITDAEKVAAATPADATAIYYINQGTDATALVANMLVKATDETTYLPTGNYIVRIGNDTGSVQNFTLESKVTAEDTSITLTYGDVNNDGSVNIADGIIALRKDAGLLETFTSTADGTVLPDQVADVNGDGSFNVADAILILRKDAGLVDKFETATGEELTQFKYTPVK